MIIIFKKNFLNALILKIKNLISVVTPTFNEEKNIKTLVYSVKEEMSKLNYQYEHIIIDNCSTDSTQSIVKEICEKEKNVKAIFNLKNFGHIRSPYYALFTMQWCCCYYIGC